MQTIHSGGVVVYEEQEVENKVMGAVLRFKTAHTRTDTCIVQQCKYKFSACIPSMSYLESLTDCRTKAQNFPNQKLTHVDLGTENKGLSADENFIQARNEYASLKVTLLTCFQHPQAPEAEHKKVIAVLSNYVTTIQPTRSTRFLIWCFILKG